MFAYCGNNPVNGFDPDGARSVQNRSILDIFGFTTDEEEDYRDVTQEIDDALVPYISLGKKLNRLSVVCEDREFAGSLSFFDVGRTIDKYYLFYLLVNHKSTWDIKVEKSWERTINTEFPGEGQNIRYHGHIYTPEKLGNYTYGVLGKAFGIPLNILLGGSYYAANFPVSSAELSNELNDWTYIIRGYYGIG